MKNTIRIIGTAFVCLFLLVGMAGCGLRNYSDMPYNGEITFHEIKITIPSDYIRDSSQSNDSLWAFEKGWYSKIVLLSHNALTKEADQTLDSYMTNMQGYGATCEKTTFLEQPAVFTTYTKDGKFVQEMLFIYNGASYAIALRGGTEQEFTDLLATVSLVESAVEL